MSVSARRWASRGRESTKSTVHTGTRKVPRMMMFGTRIVSSVIAVATAPATQATAPTTRAMSHRCRGIVAGSSGGAAGASGNGPPEWPELTSVMNAPTAGERDAVAWTYPRPASLPRHRPTG
jgi:hypothetical protein